MSCRCAFGCEIVAGLWAWFGRRRRGLKFILCRDCAQRRYGMTPPSGGAVRRDGKVAALGEDA